MTFKGSGAQLCLKFVKEITEDRMIFGTEKYVEIGSQFIDVSDPVAAAQENSIVFADDQTLERNIHSLLNSKKNCLIICYNQDGRQKFAKFMGIYGYSASASVSNYEDLLAKLRKAAQLQGMRFVEVITPCPETWLSEPSNTVELARLAVDSGILPLF